jgi:SAM-dependent MidA family methyltransferase
MTHNWQLIEIVNDRIAQSGGRVSFAEYMELVLYHPQQGYYTSDLDRISEAGDFLTSPHIAPDFGESIAIQLQQMWEIIDRPIPFTILELGAGRGFLARQILEFCRDQYPDFFAAIIYRIVEISAPAIAIQQAYLQGFNVCWQSLDRIEDNSIVGCCLSNEFFDALPVHKIIKQGNFLKEIYVERGDSSSIFREVIGDLSTPQLLSYWQLNGINLRDDRYGEDYQTEVNLAALDYLKSIDTKLQLGYILTIDYGYSADRYYNPIRDRGTLQGYYHHAHHNDPYLYIGQQDLTAHIDFTAFDRYSNSLGLHTCGFTHQGMFLVALGLGTKLANLSTQSIDLQSMLTRRQQLHQLIDPQGLGKFGVFIHAKNLSPSQQALSLIGLTQNRSAIS